MKNGQQKENNKDTLKVEMEVFTQAKSIYSTINVKCSSLISDSVSFTISKDRVTHFFETGDTISMNEAVKILSSNDAFTHNIMGNISIGQDTLCYMIHASGVGIIYESLQKLSKGKKVLFYKNDIDIPKETYKNKNKKIKILCYQKSNFDFSIWEEWRKENPDTYIDGNDEYNAYTRWNKMNVYGIYDAFNISTITTREEIRYDYYINPYCTITGLLIKDNLINMFWMNGGGAFNLFPNFNRGIGEVYGCFKPECLKYFISCLQTSE